MGMAEPSKAPRVHHLVQAPVKPLDEDGVVVGLVGTAIFAVAVGVLWFFYPHLERTGDQWWLATAITGTCLGILGTLYCYSRKRRRT